MKKKDDSYNKPEKEILFCFKKMMSLSNPGIGEQLVEYDRISSIKSTWKKIRLREQLIIGVNP